MSQRPAWIQKRGANSGIRFTILPRQASRISGSVAARPFAGTASTAISPAATASLLLSPLARAPGKKEMELAKQFFRKDALLADFCLAILNRNEFVYVP